MSFDILPGWFKTTSSKISDMIDQWSMITEPWAAQRHSPFGPSQATPGNYHWNIQIFLSKWLHITAKRISKWEQHPMNGWVAHCHWQSIYVGAFLFLHLLFEPIHVNPGQIRVVGLLQNVTNFKGTVIAFGKFGHNLVYSAIILLGDWWQLWKLWWWQCWSWWW